MTVESTELDTTQDKDPIYFVPKKVSMVSDLANILSWVVLVGFVAAVITQIIGLRAQLATQGIAIATLVREPSLYTFIFTNMVNPLLTGLGIFALLQAASVGLSMLLESDYNIRETH